jgi:hypothetical protein
MKLDEAEQKAKRAIGIGLDVNRIHALAAIQLKRHGWNEARESVLSWLCAANAEFVEANTPDVIETLKMIRALGKSSELVEMLRRKDMGAHWSSWIDALESLLDQEPKASLNNDVIELRNKLIS